MDRELMGLPFAEPEPDVGESRRDAIVVALPLAAVVGLFGVSFGVLAANEPNFGGLAAVLMSATTFAGSAQFAALSVFTAGGQPVTAIVAAILLNLRYAPIGISVAPSLHGGIVRRFLTAQLMVDESWALASRGGGRFDPRRLVIAGSMLWLAWVVGTVIGVLGGEVLGDPSALGFDAALAALFLALLVPQLTTPRAMVAALLGAVIALSLTPFTPPGVPIIAAAAGALIGWWRR